MKHFPFAVVSSTQDVARDLLSSFSIEENFFVTATSQTAGRGRQGRTWFSPEGNNLYATVVIRLPPHCPELHALTLLLSLTATEVIDRYGFLVEIKWPNDLFFLKKKVGGILGELVSHKKQTYFLGGLGLNGSLSEAALAHIGQPATSLDPRAERNLDPIQIGKEIFQTFQETLPTFYARHFLFFRDAYRKRLLHTIGDRIVLRHFSDFAGAFAGISDDGRLILQLDSGEMKLLASGELS